jgi:hypothetical protein
MRYLSHLVQRNKETKMSVQAYILIQTEVGKADSVAKVRFGDRWRNSG